MKQTTNKKDVGYESPKIEIVKIAIEKGFAASPDMEGDIDDMPWG